MPDQAFRSPSSETASSERPRPLRIFIIHPSSVLTDSRAHGDGLLACRFICELAGRGHRIDVACERVEIAGRVPDNVTLHPLPLSLERFGFISRLEYALRMRRLFERLHGLRPFDLAHQLNPVYAGLSLGLFGLKIPVVLGPYVAHWPSSGGSSLKSIALNAIAGLQQRNSTAIILAGPAARGRIVDKRIDPAAIYTVPYGIDLETFPERPPSEGNPAILYLAGISERKGIRTLLSAFDLVARELPTAELIIAGGGSARTTFEQDASRSPFHARITFIGNVPRDEVPDVLARSTVFCLASFGEPYGMSLIEAMATGRPVVATNAGGPADLVDPRGGILVPPGDVPAMAAALIRILSDRDEARRMGAFNREAMHAFAWPRIIERLEDVYTAVHARSGASGLSPTR